MSGLDLDDRGRRLRAFDAEARAFRSALAETEELGRHGAAAAIAALHALAQALADSLAVWAALAPDVPFAPGRRFESSRAARLLLESVFDDLFDPPAWRLLAAALDLALGQG